MCTNHFFDSWLDLATFQENLVNPWLVHDVKDKILQFSQDPCVGLVTYIYHKNQPNLGKYTSPMDPEGFMTRHN